MPYWVFGQEFSKTIVIFVINALQLELYRNIRILIFGTKNALFVCFGEQHWKSIVIFVINTL